MNEPPFLNDPNHRKKTLKGDLHKQLRKKKADRESLTRCDILRVSTNFAYMVRTLHLKTSDGDILNAGKAVVEHHFDNHQCCGNWCRRKGLSDEDKAACRKMYRYKQKDAVLYKYLTKTMERFVTLAALREVGHGMDTQVNESLNNTFAWYAPKNKTCCGSVSLSVRIALAVAIHTIGTERFFTRLFARLGIDITPNIAKHLKQQQAIRACRINKCKDHKVKLHRNTKLHERLKKYTEEARKENCKRDGVAYQPGMGMDGGYTEAELNQTQGQKRKREPVICPLCGKAGHKTARSKTCDQHKDNIAKRKQQAQQEGQQSLEVSNTNKTAEQQAEIDGDEADLMDQLPLDCSDDEFFDTLESETESMASSN